MGDEVDGRNWDVLLDRDVGTAAAAALEDGSTGSGSTSYMTGRIFDTASGGPTSVGRERDEGAA